MHLTSKHCTLLSLESLLTDLQFNQRRSLSRTTRRALRTAHFCVELHMKKVPDLGNVERVIAR